MNFNTNNKLVNFINSYFVVLLIFTSSVFSEQNINPYQLDFLILDSYIYDDRLWLVGEHGLILNSVDAVNWNQTQLKNHRLLTSITSNDNGKLLTAGHDANIFLSEDAGDTWTLVYNNTQIEQAIFDIDFIDNNRLIAIGSYGLYLTSSNSGESWEKTTINITNMIAQNENELGFNELHFNSISINNNTCAISAEAGVIFISKNQCQDWQVLQSPYTGSFFGAEFIDDTSIIFYGLRGNVYSFDLNTQQWKKIQTGTNETIHSSYKENESIYLLGYGSIILELNKDTFKIKEKKSLSKRNYTSLIQFKNQYYLTSDKGLERYK